MVAGPLAYMALPCTLMRRLPPKLIGTGREATHHNAIGQMVGSLRPARSTLNLTRHTAGGVVRLGETKKISPFNLADEGKAVWL